MKEELMNIIDNEYDKIKEDASPNEIESINIKIEEQNKMVEDELNNSVVVTEFLKKHNKTNINELTSSEIDELIKNIDDEINSME